MLLAVCCIIAIGIGCFIGMMSTKNNLMAAKSNYYSRSRMADFWIDLKKAPSYALKSILETSGVSEIRDRIKFDVMLNLKNEAKPVSALLLSLPDSKKPIINNIVLRQGTYFTSQRPNEVIVSEKFAKARNLHPGDSLTAILNHQKKKLIIVGTAISSEFVYLTPPGSLIDDPKNYGLLYIKRSFAENVYGFHGVFNNLVGLLTPQAKLHAKAVVKELSRKLSPFGVFISITRENQMSNVVLKGEMQQLSSLAVVFPIFFLSVSALILNVLMLRLAEQQRTVIGTLKALGYCNHKLLDHFLKFSVLTGVLGGVLGCLLGLWISQSFTTMYMQYFNFPKLDDLWYPSLWFIGIVISVLFSVLGTIKGIAKIMRFSPAEAMRQAMPMIGKSIWLEKLHTLWSHLDSQWQMICRNLLRNKTRTGVAIFSATMGSSIVVLAFGFIDSMDVMVSRQFDDILHSHYHLTFNQDLNRQSLSEIKRLPGVTHAEPVYNLACSFTFENHSKRGVIQGISADSQLTTPVDKLGKPIKLPKAGLLMPYRLMAKLGVKPGDYITVTPIKGEHRPRKLAIVAGVDSLLGLSVYANYDWLSRQMGHQVVSEVRVLTHFNSQQRTLFLKSLRNMPNLETLTDLKTQKELLNVQLNNTMRGMAFVMIFFAAFIFFGAILNATLIAFSERKRDIATFRTLGYYEKEVTRLFLRENLITNLTGTIIGLPLGLIMTTSAMKSLVNDAYSFPVAVSINSYFYTIMLAVCFVLLSQFTVYRQLRKLNWIEAMSLKE